MQETEVKILEVNRKKVEEQLRSFGAEKVFDGEVRTSFFDFKDGAIVKAKNVLRLRKEEDQAELTFKKVSFNKAYKQAEELSVDISSLETMQQILEYLGLHEIENMHKHRVSYKLGNARFDIDRYLDKYNFIPEFMEIEAENVEAIHELAGKLGFKPQDCLSWSTNDLIKHYSPEGKKKEKADV
jgi:predicted adenylyl cyclase CyaB